MSKTYDEIMKVLEEKGAIADADAEKLIKEHGALSEEEKKNVAAAIKMKKALSSGDDKGKEKDKAKDDKPKDDKGKADADEVSMDDYLKALSVLDSDDASKEDKEKAKKAKDKFESS